MNYTANRFREVILDGTWVANTNFRAQLSGLTWQQATRKVDSFNTIAALTFHIHYYIGGLLRVMQGGPLDIRDQYSFDLPPIQSEADWDRLREQLFDDAGKMAALLDEMTEAQLQGPFVDPKYGTWQRNLDGLIEHSYYHLGQIALIRKMVGE
ncbi:MAG: DinB family protein [Bacteroidia bacterium]|nr:DinB family protein [Bacteroidia bacterium]